MNLKLVLIIVIISAAIGAGLTRVFWQQTKTEIVEHEVTKDRIITVTKEVHRPDGTRESTTSRAEEIVRVVDSRTTVVQTAKPPDWGLNLSAAARGTPQYRVELQRRILGPVHAGIWYEPLGEFGTPRGENLGLSLRIEF